MRLLGTAAAAAAMVVALVGCGSVVDGPDRRVGELVESWSEAQNGSWVESLSPIDSELLSSEADVEEWVATHGSHAEEGVFDTVLSVDLEDHVLVIGGYPRCQETSAVLLVSDTEVQFVVISGDEQVACAWSPYTVDAWLVPLEETGGEVPTLLPTE